MRPLATILCLLLAGCHTPPPRGVVVSPPAQSQALGPAVDKLHREMRSVSDDNDNIRTALDRAVEEARRLKDQKSATEKELADQWKTLTSVRAIVESQKFQLQKSGDTVESLSILVGARDMEVANLRTGLNDANIRLSDAAKWQAKVEHKVAIYDWFRSKIYWVIGILVLIVIGYIVLLALNRSARAALSVATSGIIPP